ncbi:AAA family ATPase OS=Lysinibacillus sphaericus OX=1421 GN=LS41612_03025 PE=4 SV=1 [Lysinibacillus sphaericus]
MNGRSYVIPDDVRYLAPYVFRHRLVLKPDARYDDVTAEEIIERIIAKTPVPTKRLAEQ